MENRIENPNKGLTVEGKWLIFHEFPANEIGLARHCNSFKIKLEDIKLIAISPRLTLDDEELFILIINSSLEIFAMPSRVFSSNEIINLEEYFELKSILLEWEKFDYNDHYAKFDMILFPKKLYWQNLFKNDIKLKCRKILGGFVTKNFSGNFTKEVVDTATK